MIELMMFGRSAQNPALNKRLPQSLEQGEKIFLFLNS
jgi:hypothetical protein